MIDINLLPGARGKFAPHGTADGTGGQFTDPWRLVALAGLLLGGALTGWLWYAPLTTGAALAARERVAVQDSTRYAAVLAERITAEAQRDSLLRQMAVIASLDGDRFVWPHILDEVARALPTYTWLRQLQASSDTPALRIVASTVNLQAVPIFMQHLEASPFLERVTLASSESATVDGMTVHQFQLELQYQRPDSTAIRTVPLALGVQ
jgi:Tfp pilus assembly protein PilN